MPGHDSRQNLVLEDPSIRSKTSGEVLAVRDIFGGQALISSAGVETRKLPPPTMADQTITIVLIEDGGTVTVTLTSGTYDGTNTNAAFDDAGDFLVLKAIHVSPTVLAWRVMVNSGVTLS